MMDPRQVLTMASALRELYGTAETEVLRRVARRLARGIDTPGWAEAKAAELAALRIELDRIVAGLDIDGPEHLAALLEQAHRTGANAAASAVGEGLAILTNRASVGALIEATTGTLRATHVPILRSATDAYRAAIAEAAGLGVSGATTRRGAASHALARFADRGVTGFVDSRGHRWDLASYTEMATRSAIGQAHVSGHLSELGAHGHDLVRVSDSPDECRQCRPYEGRVFSINGTDPKYPALSNARAGGLFHPGCVTTGTTVSGPAVVAADTRWYEGEVVVLVTARGDELTITPNHPVLTRRGWVPAGRLVEGDELVRYRRRERMHAVGPNDREMPALIEQIASALNESAEMATMSVPATPEQFHGDGASGQVDVVLAARSLRVGQDAFIREPALQSQLVHVHAADPLSRQRSVAQLVIGRDVTAGSGVGSDNELTARIWRHALGSADGSLAATDAETAAAQQAADARLGDSEPIREIVLPPPGLVEGDHLVHLVRRQHSGHVYNLETVDGWYAASGVIVANCTHSVAAWTPGLSRPFGKTADPIGAEERARQRENERQVRHWKRREVVAEGIGDERATATAKAKVAEWQAEQRRFMADTGRRRDYRREGVGGAR